MRRAPLVYTHPDRYFFVAKDIEALGKDRIILEHAFNSRNRLLLPWDFLRQFLFLAKSWRKGARTAIVHFAGYHSVLPVLLGFRTYIVVAGSDSCSYPEINYGSFRKIWMARAMSYSMRGARAILPVHASLERFENAYSDAGPRQQGYAHHISKPIAPSIPIPYGFDVELWKMPEGFRDNNAILCIATGASLDGPIHYRKGIDLLIAAARELPDLRFTVIGTKAATYAHAPANMRFLGVVPPAQLVELFTEHGIYVQASIMEGFPNALCEAMLMGCIPIVSSMTSMPDIVDDAGRILTRRDHMALIRAIQEIRSMSPPAINAIRENARSRVLGFTMEARLQRLLEVISE